MLIVAAVLVAAPTAAAATAKDAAPKPVSIVTLNLLHGLFCPAETDSCQAPDRVQLFGEWLERVGCPDLVGIQEVGARLEELLTPAVPTWCDGDYEIAWADECDARPGDGADAPADRRTGCARHRQRAVGGVLGARDVAAGPGRLPHRALRRAAATTRRVIRGACPPACPTGITTNECHGIEVADFLTAKKGAALTVVGGDLNATPDEPAVTHLRDAGFVDAWLKAGRPECDATHRAGCTAGGTAPDPWVGMNTQEGAGFDERIDYVWVKPGKGCTLRTTAKGIATTPGGEADQRHVVAVRSRRRVLHAPLRMMRKRLPGSVPRL